MLRVSRLAYNCHYEDLSPDQRMRLFDLAADIQAEGESMKRQAERDRQIAETERAARA